MRILLVSSTKFEVYPFLHKLNKISTEGNISHYRFGSHSIDVVITGMGMTAAAFHLGRMLNKKYDLAINAGTAGSFKKNIPPGTVLNVVSDCFADVGAEDGEKFMTLKEMGMEKQIPSSKFQVPSSKIEQQTTNRVKNIRRLRQVNAITVNTVHGNAASIKKVVKKFNPDIESMEGAAFFFACNQTKTPCVQIRAVSNLVERRNKKKWKMKLAVKNLNLFLESLIGSV